MTTEASSTTSPIKTPSAIHLKERVTQGNDCGSTNWGSAIARFSGFCTTRHPVTNAVLKEGVPDIEVLRLERWDLKQGYVVTHSSDWEPLLIKLDGAPEGKQEKMPEWRANLVRCIERCQELNVKDEAGCLPVVVTENQCDHVKSREQAKQSDAAKAAKKAAETPDEKNKRKQKKVQEARSEKIRQDEMRRLAEQFQTVIAMSDMAKAQERTSRYANCKYMMRNDGAIGGRLDRKKKSVEITFELLEDLNLQGPLRYLRRLEAKGEQIHDMCDALLLAVQDQIECARAEARSMVRDIQAMIKSIQTTPTVKRKKKTSPPLKAMSEKEAIEHRDDPFQEEEEAPLGQKKRRPAPLKSNTVTKPKKATAAKRKTATTGKKSTHNHDGASDLEEEEGEHDSTDQPEVELKKPKKNKKTTTKKKKAAPPLQRKKKKRASSDSGDMGEDDDDDEIEVSVVPPVKKRAKKMQQQQEAVELLADESL